MFFFIIPSGESYCNDRSKEFSENKNIYERRAFYYGNYKNHAFVVCTHIDKSHIHNHIIWSSVSLEYDRKFRNFWGSTKAVRRLSDTICIENGLSIVENPNPHGKSYNKWLGDQEKPSHRELLRVAIDNALLQNPANFEELLKLLKESGCEVSKRGKSYRLKLSGWEKAARMDSLGEGYGLEDLQSVLSGKKAHTPRKKVVAQAEPPKVNLLVDIQVKLQAGKGAGYIRYMDLCIMEISCNTSFKRVFMYNKSSIIATNNIWA